MKLYFEEFSYPIDLLKENLGDDMSLSYAKKDNKAKIRYVGYYYNSKINDTVFIMPKVFISENKNAENENDKLRAFARYNPEKIIDISPENNELRKSGDDKVVFELTAWLYRAISHFFERNGDSDIGTDISLQNVRVTGEKSSKTIIEIIHSLYDFHKRHRNLFTYIAIVNASGNNNVHWAKTIRKEHPIFQDNAPYYLKFQNKNKVINFDEELISLFYSVLHYLSKTYHFDVQYVSGYTLLKSTQIQSMIDGGKGTRLLKKIRHNYFTDELVQLWNLLYDFFDRAEMIASGKNYQERLLVSNFNIIFEDMIDQLISDADAPKNLKGQKDGKIVDHLYKNPSLIEEGKDIYFIADSKYYKETTDLGETSIYKQFTYAKNVIQYNIDLFNDDKLPADLRYRDEFTEGYNITPNFFIRGTVEFENPSNQDYKLEKCETKEKQELNKHFTNRLFDRDTLFLQTYNINFLFVVATYVQNTDDDNLKNKIRSTFRTNLIEYISGKFEFYVLEPKRGDLKGMVEKHFKLLNGKIYKPDDFENLLILALEKEKKYKFTKDNLSLISQIEYDFYIYDYRLGSTNPQVCLKKRTSILFGIYKDDIHKKWILDNQKYFVRLDCVGDVRTHQVASAEYLVLYEYGKEDKYAVFKLGGKQICDAKKMNEMGYDVGQDGDDNNYYLYDILCETTEFGKIDIESTLAKSREIIKKGEVVNGTPIYVYKDELNHIL